MKTDRKRGTAAPRRLSRRQFVKAGALGGTALMADALGRAQAQRAARGARPPNFLFIITDQQGLDAMSAAGCRDLHTPGMDRLASRGVSFLQSYSANPLCSPARSSLFTGRMPSETGVIRNNLPIRADIPNLGEWLGDNGYETVYTGKWHVPQSYTADIPGFTVIPSGIGGQGNIGDGAVSRACEGYLHNRDRNTPFLLVASFLQPHDVCQWVSMHRNQPDELPYPEIAGKLPKLPPNFGYDDREPTKLGNAARPSWSRRQWRYYLWSYYRMVEMVDAEIHRVLDALEDAGYAANTMIVLTADHGEGRGRHQMVLKNYLYDEAAKVPFVVSYPGHAREGVQDRAHLVSGVDVVPTLCDYAGVRTPEGVVGRSLRPLLEGRPLEWREYVASEVQVTGRLIRTPEYKYVTYEGDPVEQLFDMRADPGETRNLATDARHADALRAHREVLREWEARLDWAPE